MSHYYTKDPDVKHNRKKIIFEYRGEKIRFTTDTGVFCKDRVDYGTDLMLNALPDYLQGDVLDLGCGWGAVGVTIASCNPTCSITMCDINNRAVSLAIENLEANKLDGKVLQSDGYQGLNGTYDTILLNPPIRAGKSVYFSWLKEGYNRLNAGGCFYCVAQKKQGSPSIKKELQRVFGNCEIIARSDGFHVTRSVKEV